MSPQATITTTSLESDFQNPGPVVELIDITQLFSTDINERMGIAISTVDLVVANQDTRFTKLSSEEIEEMLKRNDQDRKEALETGNMPEANKLLETSDFLSVLLHVRKKIGNSEVLSTQFSPNEIRELQTRYQYLLKNV